MTSFCFGKKTSMASFFSSNPFTTPVGQRIERATDEKLASEDWSLNLEICDIINETDEGPKDAVKAIRKRLAAPKDFKVVMLTLTVLETCVKNCNKRLHVLVCHRDFLAELTRLLNPKHNAPTIVQDKILTLIQTWADAFRGKPDLDVVVQVYQSLKAQGIEFPAQDLDSFSPIYTPEKSVPEQPHPPAQQNQQAPSSTASMTQPSYHHHPPPVQRTSTRTLTPEKLAKLRSQLDVVHGNIQVMSEMLYAATQGEQSPGDVDLLKELNRTCRSMQTRIVQLLDQLVGSEEVTEELLRVNDDLNNVFIRYDRYERSRTIAPHTENTPRTTPAQNVLPTSEVAETRPTNTAPLIDFGESDSTTTSTQELSERVAKQFEGMAISQDGSSNQTEDEFDMFAQTRQSTFEDSRKSGSTYEDNTSSLPDRTLASAFYEQPEEKDETPGASDGSSVSQPSGIEGVEDWLTVSDLPSQPTETQQSSMTSSEFDQFLQQRAISGGSHTSGKARTANRQMQKDVDESENMFGL